MKPAFLATPDDETVAIKNAAGLITAVTEQRNWIEVFFESDLMHTRTVNFVRSHIRHLCGGVPHKSTVYEHPWTMIFFSGPWDLQIARDGDRVVVTASTYRQNVG